MIKSKLSLIAFSTLFCTAAFAEQPNAEDLVGRFNLGIHANYINVDDDRLEEMTDTFSDGAGLGLEGGYRLNEYLDLRLSFTAFSVSYEKSDEDISSFNQLGFEVLYFPTAKNFYLLAGSNRFNFEDTGQGAVDLGLGYRHYFSDSFAVYAEAKANYQFHDQSKIYQTAQVGFTYFFGEPAKASSVKTSAPAKSTAPVEKPMTVVAVAPIAVIPVAVKKDSDNDGIIDANDKCNNTPTSVKVDEFGCTVFSEESLSVRFEQDQTVLKPEDQVVLKKFADFLVQSPHVKVTVAGYTSEDGSESYNQKLSQKRADGIKGILVNKYSIDEKRLTAVGHGEDNLLDKSNTTEAHNKNRRIELYIDYSEQESE